jgi:hypothetical protein
VPQAVAAVAGRRYLDGVGPLHPERSPGGVVDESPDVGGGAASKPAVAALGRSGLAGHEPGVDARPAIHPDVMAQPRGLRTAMVARGLLKACGAVTQVVEHEAAVGGPVVQ